jgi:hypothetical protein
MRAELSARCAPYALMDSEHSARTLPRMLVNLDKAASIVISGGKVQVYFQDTSIHMRRFRSRRELKTILDGWHIETRALRSAGEVVKGR